MIENGWIFPDGTEYSCGVGCIHEQVVSWFVDGLKYQNPKIHEQIYKEIDDLFFKRGSRYLYSNYAIRRLGWIKVGRSVWHTIEYAGYDWQPKLVEPYADAGYSVDNLYLSSSNYMKLDCNILLAIQNG